MSQILHPELTVTDIASLKIKVMTTVRMIGKEIKATDTGISNTLAKKMTVKG